MLYRGGCHCGAVKLIYESAVPPAAAELRACQCGFCRRHGSVATSDPAGRLAVSAAPGDLLRYRFGLQTADYLLCRHCGVYLAAVMQEGESAWSVVIVNALEERARFTAPVRPVDYDAEDEAGRRRRRRARWTPTELLPAEAPPA